MASHPPLELLPFVSPVTDHTLTELDFSLAVDDWNDSLSRILRYNIAGFWKELAINDTLPAFLNSFLGEYAQFKGDRDDNWVLEASEVVRRVLFVYKRVAETIDKQAVHDAVSSLSASLEASSATPASMLLDRGIVSTPILLDLASIYGRSDPEIVAFIVNSLLENIPWLVDDFGASAKTVVQIIRRVQKKFEKGVRGSQGKGKGKSVSSDQDDSALYHNLSHEEVQEALQVAHMLHNIVLALDSIAAASPLLGVSLEKQDSFLQCVSGCYNYTLPVLWKVLTENPAGHEPRTIALMQNLRVRTLSIVSNILDDIYKSIRLGSGSEPLSDEQKMLLTERICGIIMEIFDQSPPISESVVPMVDAPMIVDLELQFEITEKLKNMIVETFEGSNDRLHNLVVMLESLRKLNNATLSYAEDLSLKKTERLARKLNNIYLNESREHSASTISSAPMTAHQHQQHHPAGSEEDYVKRTMLISQLQDLFPDLGDGFLEACLMEFNDDPEVVTMQLLEDNLPASLATMDRSTPRMVAPSLASAPMTEMALVPATAPLESGDLLATRRNIFDGDEFDVFAGKNVNRSRMSRKKAVTEADDMLEDKSFVTENKSSILQAVENMYDDEYDDTYDSMGISNASADLRMVEDIDLAADEPDGRQQSGAAPMRTVDPSVEHEEVLINLFMGDKTIFSRTREARKSKKRQELRQLTKMTDEQLEGWAIMFNRNPRKEDLARKYEFVNTFSGNERTLERTEFGADKRRGGRLSPFEKPQPQQQGSQQGNGQRQRGPAAGDGKERGGRSSPRPGQGTGPGAAKRQGQQGQQQQNQPKSEHADAKGNKTSNSNPSGNERAKNERNKASKANHNRRNAHAKKMASMHP